MLTHQPAPSVGARCQPEQVGWMRSMSGWAGYEAAHPGAADQLAEELQAALGVPDRAAPAPMVWPLTMLLAKQPRPL